MGHGSVRAAMIYQHATDKRDRAIADAMSLHVDREQAKRSKRAKRAQSTTILRFAEMATVRSMRRANRTPVARAVIWPAATRNPWAQNA